MRKFEFQWRNSNFRKFCWVIRTQPCSVLKIFLLYQSELHSEHLSRYLFFNISLLAKDFIFTIEDKMIVHFVNIMCCKYYVSNLVYFIFSKDLWRFSAWYFFLSILSHEATFLLNILKCSSRYDYLNETSD